jgi:hypothetical protein
MVDADMRFTAEDVVRIFEYAEAMEPAVHGGLCFAVTEDEVRPTLMVAVEKPDGRVGTERIWDYPRDSAVEVDGTGAAFLLIPRALVVEMGEKFEPQTVYPWFAESELDGEELGEDSTFCMRARSLGYKVIVHTDIKIGHRKPHTYTEDDYWAWRRADTAKQRAEMAQ